mgnify:CR=1 FL=1
MIAFIQGELCDAGQDTIVVVCHGIGYEIQIPVSVAQALPDPGNVVKIYTYTYVREDALGLFGFLTQDDLKIFKLLITVNGVGPKAALAILSAMTADELRFAILAEDAKAIAKAFPVFILGFLALAIVNTIVDFSSIHVGNTSVAAVFKIANKFLITIALVGVGSKMKLKELFTKGIRPVILGGVTWIVIAIVTLCYDIFLV